MKQYCRYCCHCFQAEENEFRCSDHPEGKQPHWNRKQISKQNHCPNFVLSILGDAETGRTYRPIVARSKTGIEGQIRMDEFLLKDVEENEQDC